jgi:hypothetical protein
LLNSRTNRQTCLDRAALARAEAEAASLPNVRERCLRAEAAWTEMADRADRTEQMRVKLLAEKSLERSSLNEPSAMNDRAYVEDSAEAD